MNVAREWLARACFVCIVYPERARGRSGCPVWAFVCLAALLPLCLAVPVPAITQVRNFSEDLRLTPAGNGRYVLGNGGAVALTNRVIIKADGRTTKDDILRAAQGAKSVRTLYVLPDGTYFAVAFDKAIGLGPFLSACASLPFVHKAQPDLLQLHAKAARAPFPGATAACLAALDLPARWATARGEGVRVAIIDDGFDLTHEDLRGVALVFGFDMATKSLDPSPRGPADTHGTRVAGVIFAQHNGVGVKGIAPNAELIAIRHTDTWTSATLLSFYLAKLAGADVINCSWTPGLLLEPVAEALTDLAVHGRRGKGVAVVFAAGNKGKELSGRGGDAALRVGAADPGGNRLPFSNYGKKVALYALGKNIPTTTCGEPAYGLFSGTSASAAVVSGMIALLISRDPEISLAHIRDILRQGSKGR